MDCGKGLCQTCTVKYEKPICNECNAKRNQGDKINILGIVFKKILPSIVLFIAAFFICVSFGDMDFPVPILIGYWVMSIPWGWGKVNSWMGRGMAFPSLSRASSSDFDAFMGPVKLIIFVIYWVFRFVLVVAIGGILFPIEVIKLIYAGIKAKKVESDIEHNS
jgi:hypothetical protein